jgi:hypothetical protein
LSLAESLPACASADAEPLRARAWGRRTANAMAAQDNPVWFADRLFSNFECCPALLKNYSLARASPFCPSLNVGWCFGVACSRWSTFRSSA